MSHSKGFTLLEVILALLILSILAAISVPIYTNYTVHAQAQAAQNNLIAIYNAEKNFYLSNTNVPGPGPLPYYCTTSTQNTTCADTLADLNANLNLNITDNYFTYSCTDPNSALDANDGSSFSCRATNVKDPILILTLTNNSIILPNGPGCAPAPAAAPTSWPAPCNPACVTDNFPYCPAS